MEKKVCSEFWLKKKKKRKIRIRTVSHVTAGKNEGSDSGPVLISRTLSITSANNCIKPFMFGWVDTAQR